MTPDYVTWMAVSKLAREHAQSALPDAPVIDDFIDRTPRAPGERRITLLRKQLATLIWPGELVTPTFEPVSAAPCR